jgi:hypothetical protein
MTAADNTTTTVSVRSFPADVWRRFQAECILRNIKPSHALKEAIENWLLKTTKTN